MNPDFARKQMVEQQLRVWDVSDAAVLGVVRGLARDRFVPRGYEQLAYADTAIPLGHGQHMMTPQVEGRLLQALAIQPADRVLEIGTGSAYLTACLASLAGELTSIDIHDDFVGAAGQKLEDAGIEGVELRCMDATRELPDGEFDAIAVTASLPRFDERLLGALRADGRLFVVVGQSPVMSAQLVRKSGDETWTSTSLFETDLAPMVNVSRPPTFSF